MEQNLAGSNCTFNYALIFFSLVDIFVSSHRIGQAIPAQSNVNKQGSACIILLVQFICNIALSDGRIRFYYNVNLFKVSSANYLHDNNYYMYIGITELLSITGIIIICQTCSHV